MPNTSDELPGKGFLGWLGRQVGHVAKAVQADVSEPSMQSGYHVERVDEVPHPTRPGVLLRRTTTDEIIVQPGGAQPTCADRPNPTPVNGDS